MRIYGFLVGGKEVYFKENQSNVLLRIVTTFRKECRLLDVVVTEAISCCSLLSLARMLTVFSYQINEKVFPTKTLTKHSLWELTHWKQPKIIKVHDPLLMIRRTYLVTIWHEFLDNDETKIVSHADMT